MAAETGPQNILDDKHTRDHHHHLLHMENQTEAGKGFNKITIIEKENGQ